MILDSSAIVAIFLKEPGHEEMLHKLASTSSRAIGSPTLAESGIVLTAKMSRNAIGLLARFLQEADVVSVPFGDEHWKEAVDAFERYGRGQHRASLNFGDCMTYSVARLADEPLLCVGEDFAQTDLLIA
ncbi:MAG: type II toxin-antitoxin system VapC family toxin [Actinomycetota bacterium]